VARCGEESGCAPAMGLLEARWEYQGTVSDCLEGVWPSTLKVNDEAGSTLGGLDRTRVLKEAIASAAVLFMHHHPVVEVGADLLAACEDRIARLVAPSRRSCLQCGETLLPVWRPAKCCAACRFDFCQTCAPLQLQNDVRTPEGKGRPVHLCNYCTKLMGWQEAHAQVGNSRAVWLQQGHLPIVEDVDATMQEVSQVQKAHMLKKLLQD